jgi:hypothetical protein
MRSWASDYSRGHRDSHCGHAFEGDKNYCRHFIEPPTGAHDLGACEKVSGAISWVYWCRSFARAQGPVTLINHDKKLCIRPPAAHFSLH